MYTKNSDTFPYKLSIHAAQMLLLGMIQYHQQTERLFADGIEEGDFCDLRAYTSSNEAIKLCNLLEELPARLVSNMINDLDLLREDIRNSRNRFAPSNKLIH